MTEYQGQDRRRPEEVIVRLVRLEERAIARDASIADMKDALDRHSQSAATSMAAIAADVKALADAAGKDRLNMWKLLGLSGLSGAGAGGVITKLFGGAP